MSATTEPTTSQSGEPTKPDRRWEILLLVSSLVAAVLFVAAAYHEIAMAPWRGYQREYRAALIAGADDLQSRLAAESFEIRYYQSYLPGLGRVDRCTTCHLGAENPAMKDAEEPLRTHPGDILQHHPVDRFGCTICHGGRGRATEEEEAHGENSHRPAPMRRGEMLQVACAQCHSDAELPAVPVYNLSRKLFSRKACLACHSLRGTGPTLRGVTAIQGPDLTEEADKREFQWHVDHFLDPQKAVEGSKMPNFGFKKEEARALAFLMMSFTGEGPTHGFIPLPTDGGTTVLPPMTPDQLGADIDPKAAPGYVGSKTCLACHAALNPGLDDTWKNSKMAHAFDAVQDVADNEICLPCHTTGHDSDTNAFAEASVGCEACHGPGKQYVIEVLAGNLEDHKTHANAGVLQKDRCLTCHKTVHVATETHEETIRAASKLLAEAAVETEEEAAEEAAEEEADDEAEEETDDEADEEAPEEADERRLAALESIGANLDPKAAPGHVGSEACLFCHSSLNPELAEHWPTTKKATTFEAVRDVPDNKICLPCHTTGYNPDTNVFTEPNVGCEACHGPGKEYSTYAVEEKRGEHAEQANANHQDENRCVDCHRVHVPRDRHVETIREEAAVQ